MVGKLVGHAAEEELGEPATSAAPDHHEIGIVFVGDTDDRGSGRTVDQFALHGDTGVGQRCAPVTLECGPDFCPQLGRKRSERDRRHGRNRVDRFFERVHRNDVSPQPRPVLDNPLDCPSC